MTWLRDQIQNRNFLSPIGFKFILAKYPKTVYFCQTANIPSISLGTPEQPTPFVPIPMEGSLKYSELTLRFLVDEDLENYLAIHNWMRGLGVPDSFLERQQFERENTSSSGLMEKFADGTLQVLNSNLKANFNVIFEDLFPISLSTLQFDCTMSDVEYFTAEVSFRYKIYEIQSLLGQRR